MSGSSSQPWAISAGADQGPDDDLMHTSHTHACSAVTAQPSVGRLDSRTQLLSPCTAEAKDTQYVLGSMPRYSLPPGVPSLQVRLQRDILSGVRVPKWARRSKVILALAFRGSPGVVCDVRVPELESSSWPLPLSFTFLLWPSHGTLGESSALPKIVLYCTVRPSEIRHLCGDVRYLAWQCGADSETKVQ
ncbi:hypothetical protein CDV31_014458 [Fusarium ambrosium]|uniref:Uncharacterized protein n=1 Tax=Fusarium ambrosium TaxID=131363 RepID=A0A428SW80_9HYPO|nr:hypothetical protein CDV31_014458 [Fusarium ambrosium]